MSRSPAESVLRLEAKAWVLAASAGGPRGDGLATARGAFDGDPAAALAALDAAPMPRGGALRVEIDDGWLRYLVVSWPPGISRRDERIAYLAHRFREVHGVGDPEWLLAWDRDPVHFPVLACAAPRAIVDAARAWAHARRLKLTGVTGSFVHRFNRLQRRLDGAANGFGALAVGRRERLTVGLWREGAWQAIRSQAVGEEAAQTLRVILEGWTLGAAVPSAPGILYASGIAADAPDGWRVEALEEEMPGDADPPPGGGAASPEGGAGVPRSFAPLSRNGSGMQSRPSGGAQPSEGRR